MSLVYLPHEVWRLVLLDWLGDLRNVLNVDRACSLAAAKPLLGVCAGECFSFSNEVEVLTEKLLVGLCMWMRERNVFINKFTWMGNDGTLLPQWKDVMLWSAENIQCLTIHGIRPKPWGSLDKSHENAEVLLSWASKHLKQLQDLRLEMDYHPEAASVAKLLQNNAYSLQSIRIIVREEDVCKLGVECPKLSNLQVLQWSLEGICQVIRGCPNLVALCVSGRVTEEHECVISCIATSCPQLKRLSVVANPDLPVEALLNLASKCPLLEYLALPMCTVDGADRLAEVVHALSRLHTLISHDIDQNTLLNIGAQGHPCLRILETWTEFTYAAFRQFTANMPQLTGLGIYSVVLDPCTNGSDLLEYCGGLQILKVGGPKWSKAVNTKTANAILHSVDMHCWNLHTLIIPNLTPQSSPALGHVLMHCNTLYLVGTDYCFDFQERYMYDNVGEVTCDYPAYLDAWMPDIR